MNLKPNWKSVLLVCSLGLLAAAGASAKVTLNDLFTDNMILQQRTKAPIWGTAAPGKTVMVTTSWNKKPYSTAADADGNWKLEVQTPKAGGPYKITISDGEPVVIDNVAIGEVWIASGQSNMEMGVEEWGPVYNWEEEKRTADYPEIRLLTVNRQTVSQPATEFTSREGGWLVCTPDNVYNFSACAYFFGRNLYQNLKVPIGLINTSWSGTPAESWASPASLMTMPGDFRERTIEAAQMPADPQAQRAYTAKVTKEWYDKIDLLDKGMIDKWAAPGFDDSQWKSMKVPGLMQKQGLEGFNGMVWFRKTIDIPAQWAGKELRLSLGSIDDGDDTYFNGIRVGGSDNWQANRNYTIPAELVREGKAVVAVRVFDTGGTGGFTGRAENVYIQLNSSDRKQLAGDWKYSASLANKDIPRKPKRIIDEPDYPGFLYNGMIHPLAPYGIKGFIWYQGEANTGRAYQYRDLLPMMIQSWRDLWKQELPFYIVSLAGFFGQQTEPVNSSWAELREAQMMTAQNLENTGIAMAFDIGDQRDLHPKNKQDVGRRLALAALARTYGKKISYSGPIYASHVMEGNKIRIRFNHTDGGLTTKDNGPLVGFSIAGVDHKFYWADAVIEGDEIVLSSDKVPFPVAARYAWADFPLWSLYNGAGLPAVPFRTDDWQGITYNGKY